MGQTTVLIGGKHVGPGNPCFIIAEAGVNHNGDLATAKELVRAAKRAGADCVKFQTFTADRIITDNAPKANYQLKTTDPKESQKEMLKKLELPHDAYPELLRTCQEEGIVFMSTPYNEEDVDFLDSLGTAAFKGASIHLFEPSFLAYVAKKGKPLIVSMGMATLDDVLLAVEAVRATGNEQFILLQCTTNYPSRIQDANIKAMLTVHNATGVLVGYSDHTQTDTACIASVALGACVIEKHFTLNTNLPGPDQSTSYDPAEFTRLVRAIRETEVALGNGVKEPCEAERVNAVGMRRSIVAKEAIPKGTILMAEMFTFKRPGTGVPPAKLATIIGKRTNCNLAADAFLHEACVE
jgi:N-acetylneuraminate synthase/N,N'-diacetyllegionaminate synthase